MKLEVTREEAAWLVDSVRLMRAKLASEGLKSREPKAQRLLFLTMRLMEAVDDGRDGAAAR